MLEFGSMASSSVPAFLTKLWALVENPTCDELICWDASGTSFHVYDQGRFSKEILPLYFKHSNIASFIRQLNMYGFRKVVHIETGLKTERDDVEFQHPYFQQGQEHLLEHIKRKVSTAPAAAVKVEPPAVQLNKQDVNKVLNDVRTLRGKQDNMNTKLESVKRENEILWREVASLRQKHLKQQQIVNKLIQFLVHLVGGQRGVPSMKRKLPLMISNSSQEPSNKIAKYSGSGVSENPNYTVQSPLSTTSDSTKPGQGLIIHDVTEQDPSVVETVKTDRVPTGQAVPSTYTVPTSSAAASELSLPDDVINPPSFSETDGDPDMFLGDILGDTLHTDDLPATSTSSALSLSGFSESSKDDLFTRSEMSDQLDNLQVDIDSLRELLGSNLYQMDSSHLSGLFNPDLPVVIPDQEAPSNTGQNDDTKNLITGNELITYKNGEDVLPDLFDLAAMTNQEDDIPTDNFEIDGLKTPQIKVSADELD